MVYSKRTIEMFSKGFTVIELLIIIAIIAVLASIVFTNVANYIAKSKDASIRSRLAEIQLNGFVYYETYGTYNPSSPGTFCNDPVTDEIFNSIDSANKRCNNNANQWRACARINIPANGSMAWCVDSTGNKKQITNNQCNNSSSPCP